MNSSNSSKTKIRKADYFRLPSNMRAMTDTGPMVMTTQQGRQTFVPAEIIE